jgi:Flp pilus assembly protein TadD
MRLGTTCEKTGRTDAARAEYAEALRLYPQHVDAKKALDALK